MSHNLPLRFLGMGLFIAWLCGMHTFGVFHPVDMTPDKWNIIDYAMRTGDISTLLILAIALGGRSTLSSHRTLITGLTLLSCICAPLVIFWAVPSGMPDQVVFLLSVLIAPGGAVLFLLWAEVYGQLGLPRVTLYGSASCVAAGVVGLLVYLLRSPFGIILTVMLPCLSLACAALSLRSVPAEHLRTEENGKRTRYAVPWRLILLMALAGFASTCIGSLLLQEAGTGSLHRIMSTFILGLVILCAMAFSQNGFDLKRLVVVILPTSIAALILTPVLGESGVYIVSLLAKFSYVAFTFFVLAVLAGDVYRLSVPSLWTFGFARAASEGAIFAGLLTRSFLRTAGLTDSTPSLCVISVIGIVIIALCVVIWRSEKTVTSDWGMLAGNLGTGAHVQSPRERFLETSDDIAEKYGLTSREKDILELLASGKSGPEIEDELFLSHNTVKTHTRHLYAKLGLHSRDEIRELYRGVI